LSAVITRLANEVRFSFCACSLSFVMHAAVAQVNPNLLWYFDPQPELRQGPSAAKQRALRVYDEARRRYSLAAQLTLLRSVQGSQGFIRTALWNWTERITPAKDWNRRCALFIWDWCGPCTDSNAQLICLCRYLSDCWGYREGTANCPPHPNSGAAFVRAWLVIANLLFLVLRRLSKWFAVEERDRTAQEGSVRNSIIHVARNDSACLRSNGWSQWFRWVLRSIKRWAVCWLSLGTRSVRAGHSHS